MGCCGLKVYEEVENGVMVDDEEVVVVDVVVVDLDVLDLWWNFSR